MYRHISNGSTVVRILGLSLLGVLAALGQSEDPNATSTCAKTTGPCGNKADGTSTTVAGGYLNIAGNNRNLTGPTTDTDAVGGGFYNTAFGGAATVPGGAHNTAAGNQSFAAGSQTYAAYQGDFVWGDSSTGTQIISTAPNQFVVRSAGGIWLGTNDSVSIGSGQFIATSTGAYLSTGGTWTNNSDRNLKLGLTAVDGQSVLQRLAGVPMFTWNYKAQPGSVRHIGPMAQDFHQAFALGEDDKHISTVDAEGVALAAIQELYRDSLAKNALIASLTAELEKMKAVERKVNALAARLSNVESGAAPLQQAKGTASGGVTQGW